MNNNVIFVSVPTLILSPKVLQGVSEEIIRMATPVEDLNPGRVSNIDKEYVSIKC